MGIPVSEMTEFDGPSRTFEATRLFVSHKSMS